MIKWMHTAPAILLALTMLFSMIRPAMAGKAVPPWPSASVVYCVYPSIFSAQRNFAGVTAQMGRLKRLGITVLWLMPVTPIGHAVSGHPNVASPYCVHDYSALNPDYGSKSDFQALVAAAHKRGIKVILDEVLNHTAWDNALITQHPEYFVHSDGNPKNPASIVQAFNFADVAQLNYANTGLRKYMIRMLGYWIQEYKVDGFRYDTADDPDGPKRMISAEFWRAMGRELRRVKPDVLLLGECETPDLALNPFALDYGWDLHGALQDASNGRSAAGVQTTWQQQVSRFPPGMRHMSIQDDWDYSRDVNTFGGPAGAQAAAVFNFTDTGVPMIYNGMEIGNAAGNSNPHDVIRWRAGDPRFPQFYHSLIALRSGSTALRQGAMTWLSNSVPSEVLTYTRAGGGSEFLVEINLSSNAAHGTVKAPAEAGWTEVVLAGTQSNGKHAAPPQVSLPPKGFALFQRSSPKS